jgi:transcriptional regulator with PAS, ATPase and Fis domain
MRASAPLLLTGESGVGKELAARAVHVGSERNAGPFVPVNCGALPPALIESLLFGHERGSFTGAHERQIGSIEAAAHGTIFLDEIGDLPRPAQASLLRFLQESTVTRVGSTRELRIDARVIAATHKDLSTAVRAGEFREDLFYRLNVLHIEIPPLRARGADCVLLAEHFLHREIIGCPSGVRGFSESALTAIQRHSWPGNIRELLNKVQHAVVMCNGPLITPTDLQLERRGAFCVSGSLADARAGTERQLIEIALDRSGHNIAAAARELGVSRVTLYRILKRLGMSPRGGFSALDS